MVYKKEPSFNRVRAFLFPIERWELPKFLPMALMIFITIFNLTMLRNAKDALMVTAPGSGAESITFLKLYGVLPMTFIGSLFYIKLRKATSFSFSYYAIVLFFICFFLFFQLVLFPHAADWQPSVTWVNELRQTYPRLQHLIPLYGVWIYALFYVFSELWGAMCLSILFWQMANDTIGPNEAKRFYPLLVMSGNVSILLLSGVMRTFTRLSESLIVINTVNIAIVLAVILLVCFYYLDTYVLPKSIYQQDILEGTKRPKKSLTFFESLRAAAHSPYIGYIALLVMSYGIIINLIDVTWKSQLLLYTGSLKSYYTSMTDFTFWMGFLAIVFVYLSKGVIRRYGWRFCALITPVAVSVTGVLFFVYLLYKDSYSIFGLVVAPQAVMTVLIGGLGLLLSKSSKYSFFDPTKEMVFIPLKYDLRVVGKAAVDGVGGRLGESCGGLIQGVLLILTAGSQVDIAPYLMVIVMLLSGVWLVSVWRLNALYQEELAKNQAADS